MLIVSTLQPHTPPPTSRSSRQMDSGALVSSLDVSRVSLGKSCFSQSRRAGLWPSMAHCSPSQLRCWRSPTWSRMEPREENTGAFHLGSLGSRKAWHKTTRGWDHTLVQGTDTCTLYSYSPAKGLGMKMSRVVIYLYIVPDFQLCEVMFLLDSVPVKYS